MYKTIPFLFCFLFAGSAAVLAQVDYEEEIQPIFNGNCLGCHGGNGTNGVILSSYSSVMSSVGNQYGTEVVEPGEPDESPIVDKISSDDPEFGVRMPEGGPYLSENEINLIRTWIEEGANETPVSNELMADLPDGFKLKGNYPNPFNPTTIVSFEVPEAVSFQIKIYTVHGAIVEEIAGNAAPGEASVQIELNNQPSGVYFYQVIATTGNKKYLLGSERMTLVK